MISSKSLALMIGCCSGSQLPIAKMLCFEVDLI